MTVRHDHALMFKCPVCSHEFVQYSEYIIRRRDGDLFIIDAKCPACGQVREYEADADVFSEKDVYYLQ